MSFRTVIIKNRAKLEFRLNYLVVRGEQERKIHLSEVSTLIVQSTAVSMTASLLSELIRNHVKVIFCDEKCSPMAELLPYYDAHNTSKRYKEQFCWDVETKAILWQKIVKQKILEQATFLQEKGFDLQSKMLWEYAQNVQPNDVTNREGHAAKVYFNCLLGEGVSRKSGGFINGCLNYGYAVLLSAFNREITASGYLTQLGIWHDNEYNSFNLSCDLMEPLRIVVDRAAFSLQIGDAEFKKKMADVLNYRANFDEKNTTLDVAIREYCRSVFYALKHDDVSALCFPQDVKKDEL